MKEEKGKGPLPPVLTTALYGLKIGKEHDNDL